LFYVLLLDTIRPVKHLLKGLIMATHLILADVSAGISELKKNPMAVMEQGEGFPVAILNRNEPVFYAIPAAAYELLMDKLEDIELAQIVRERKGQPSRVVTLDEL
jgi:antitoxin StbD